jgi:hypothetical protein
VGDRHLCMAILLLWTSQTHAQHITTLAAMSLAA